MLAAIKDKAAQKRRRRLRRQSRKRLSMERLEPRLVLATVAWDGGPTGLGTDWNVEENWDGDVAPGAGDDAVIGAAFEGVQIQITSNTTVNSVTSEADLRVGFATFTVGNDADDTSTIKGDFLLQGGTLSGQGLFQADGLMRWTGGEIRHSDVVINGKLELAGDPAKTIRPSGKVTNAGAETGVWSAGGLGIDRGIFVNAAPLRIETDAPLNFAAGTFQNVVGGTITKTGTTGVQTFDAIFDNDGAVIVESGTLEIRYPNSNGQSDDGVYDVRAGAELRFHGVSGSRSLSANSSVIGDGLVNYSQGTISINSGVYTHSGPTAIGLAWVAFNIDVTLSSLTQTGGDLAGSSNIVRVLGDYELAGGELRHANIVSDGQLLITGSGFNRDPRLESGSQLTNNGVARWTGSAPLRIRSGAEFINAGEFRIETDAAFDGANRTGAFYNLSGAKVVKTTTTGVQAITVSFDNDGSVIVESGTLVFNYGNTDGQQDDGVWEVKQPATLEFGPHHNETRTLSAASTVTGDGHLRFSGNTVLINSGVYDHSGATTIVNGWVSFNIPVVFSDLTSQQGVIAGGGGALRVTGVYELAGGEIRHPNVISDGQLLITGSGWQRDPRLKFGGRLTNNGFAHWTGSEPIRIKDATFVNAGQFVIETDADLDGANSNGLFQNLAGAVVTKKTTSTGTQIVSVPFENDGVLSVESGTMHLTTPGANFASSGPSKLERGVWRVSTADPQINTATLRLYGVNPIKINQATIELDGVGASMQINGNGDPELLSQLHTNLSGANLKIRNGYDLAVSPSVFQNEGELTVGAGSTLDINGDFTQTADAKLTIGLGDDPATDDYGRLNTSGEVDLDGTFAVALDNGFGPSSGQVFPVMQFAGRTGDFRDFEGLWLGGTKTFDVVRNADSVVINALADASDLVVDPLSITIAGSGVVGEDVTVEYTVNNASSTAASGDWLDSIYLSEDLQLDYFDTLLGRVEHVGGVAGLGSYSQSLTTTMPALPPGNYRVFVVQDSRGVVPDQNRADNTAMSSGVVTSQFVTLPVGDSVTDQIADGEERYYRVEVPVGGEVRIAADFATADQARLYSRLGGTPSAVVFDQRTTGRADHGSLVLRTPGVHFLLLSGNAAAAAGENYTLSAEQVQLAVTELRNFRGGNQGSATVTVLGTGFTDSTIVELLDDAGDIAATANVQKDNGQRLFATFNLTGVTAGDYDLRVTQDTVNVIAATKYEVTEQAAGELELELALPDRILAGSIGKISVRYRNTGGTDLPAELFMITVALGEVRLEGSDASFSRQRVQALTVPGRGIGNSPIGVIAPGEQGSVWFDVRRIAGAPGSDMHVFLDRAESPDEPFDVADFEDQFRPDHFTAEAWAAVLAGLRTRFGTTIGEYNAALIETATYLQRIGQPTRDVRELVMLELLRADNALSGNRLGTANDIALPVTSPDLNFQRNYRQQLSSRLSVGSLGYGWRHEWETRLIADQHGNLLLQDLSGDGFFQYSPAADLGGPVIGDPRLLDIYVGGSAYEDVLRPADDPVHGDVFRFRRADGVVLVFDDDPLTDVKPLVRIEDPNDNRVNLSYTDGLLTTVASDSGQTLTLAYNADDRLASVTDQLGRATTYEYDASGDHLVRVVGAEGATLYEYDTTSTDSREHSLLNVERANGATTSYQYDSLGRLIRSDQSGLETLDFAYGTGGEMTITDAAGAVTTMRYDARGRAAEIVDANGGLYEFHYGEQESPRMATNGVLIPLVSAGNLNRVVLPDGREVLLQYDSFGNVTFSRDPAGATVESQYANSQFSESRPILTYLMTPSGHTIGTRLDIHSGNVAENIARDRVASYSDENGDTTTFDYANGNLTSIHYVDQWAESFAYDADGNLLNAVNRRGQMITYDYDTRGLMTGRQRSGAGAESFTYNSAGSLTTSTNSTGTTTYEYDAAGRIIRLQRPDGRELNYTYDAVGNRTQLSDGAGFEVNYAYDAAGRLTEMQDAADSLLVAFQYDVTGRLARQNNANGTYTTYAYDGNGQTTSIVHHAPNDTVTSRFDYSYDALGRRTSMTTLEGTTIYGYDASGNLTDVALPTGRRIEYAYDAAGNRLSVNDDGQTTNYVVDEQGRYTLVGAIAREYDADGNLVLERTADDEVTQYVYDAQSKLIRVSGPDGATSYEYDSLGNRIATVRDGQRTEYLVDPTGLGSVIAAFDASGDLISHYAHGPFGLVAGVNPGGDPAFYQFDYPGSTTAITGAGGAVLNEYEYLPFGEVVSATETIENPFTYIGELGVMDEGGLQFMRNRYYDSATGAFTSLDPLRAPAVEPYGYADNDPLRYVDPEGLAFRLPRPNFGRPRGGVDPMTNRGITSSQNLAQGGPPPSLRDAACNGVGSFIGGATAGIFFNIACGTNEDTIRGVEGLVRQGSCGTINAEAARQLAAAGFPECEAGTIDEVASFDPNDILGPAGVGPEYHIDALATLPYTVRFENLEDATAPAAEVLVTAILDDDLNLDTFQFGSFGFGELVFDVPADLDQYETRIQVRADLLVDVQAELDRENRLAIWTFTSLDPTTLDLPANPFGGFLPPNVTSPEGQGFVNYSVQALDDALSGARIDAVARIEFDANEPIDTPVIFNTIDRDRPTSSVAALPAEIEAEAFAVRWSGQDNTGGSGVVAYDVFVSTNGGPYEIWLNNTSATTADYTGAFDNTYSFYSLATDRVGWRESKAENAEATTTLLQGNLWHNRDEPLDVTRDGQVNLRDAFSVIAALRERGVNAELPAEGPGPGEFAVDVNNNGKIDLADAFLAIDALRNGSGEGESSAASQWLAEDDDFWAILDERLLDRLARDR